MLDYLNIQGSTEYPTFVTIVFTILLSFLLASLIAYTYDKTSRHVVVPLDFLQAIILVSIAAAMIMQAIGDSLARGLGMLGALAIIRFRTNVKAPRNMVFVFASLAAGIACGVYGYVIGITGTIGFCAVAFTLRYSPMSRRNNLSGDLKFDLPANNKLRPNVNLLLDQFCLKYKLLRFRIGDSKKTKNEGPVLPPNITYEYQLKMKNEEEIASLNQALSELPGIKSIRICFDDLIESI